ncbi:MAG: glycosyltransferase family 2 protein [Proteobacteria bacterium]|nr:glycosyltransferase family 2 protein [Pseudomonadota bacterium]
MKVAVVIPTKNEEGSIASVIGSVRQVLSSVGHEAIIYITDDSHDKTRQVAEELGAVVIRGSGDGLGTAMLRGLKGALAANPDVIMSVDADGQVDIASELLNFLGVIQEGEFDLVIGSRFIDEGLIHYQYRRRNRLGIRILVGILCRQTGLSLTDSHGGIRAMTPAVVKELEMIGSHTYVQETIIDAHEKGFRILEIPSKWLPRQYGSSKVVKSIPRYVMYTLPVLFLRSGKHIRWLNSLGLLSFLGGILFFGVILAQEGFTYSLADRLPGLTLVALLITTGLQLFFFGLVLQFLKQIKKQFS